MFAGAQVILSSSLNDKRICFGDHHLWLRRIWLPMEIHTRLNIGLSCLRKPVDVLASITGTGNTRAHWVLGITRNFRVKHACSSRLLRDILLEIRLRRLNPESMVSYVTNFLSQFRHGRGIAVAAVIVFFCAVPCVSGCIKFPFILAVVLLLSRSHFE